MTTPRQRRAQWQASTAVTLDEPVPPTPRPCGHPCPCGGECDMKASVAHEYHSCSDPDCGYCHDDLRFGRAQRSVGEGGR